MNAPRRWEKFEDQLLRELATHGLNAAEMRKEIGRSDTSIRGRARKLGITIACRGRHYAPPRGDRTSWDRAERLCAFANVPIQLARYVVDVADMRGIQLSELRSELRPLKLVRIRANIARKARAHGFTCEAIGRALNRDHTTVVYYLHHRSSAQTA